MTPATGYTVALLMAVFAFILGAAMEHRFAPRNTSYGVAYGCGLVAALHDTNARLAKALGREEKPFKETSWCASYRNMWERP